MYVYDLLKRREATHYKEHSNDVMLRLHLILSSRSHVWSTHPAGGQCGAPWAQDAVIHGDHITAVLLSLDHYTETVSQHTEPGTPPDPQLFSDLQEMLETDAFVLIWSLPRRPQNVLRSEVCLHKH
ncbi:uncharacterized protein LOC143291851 [Babylonia areolata]|uniref:uncharacterized protein LOC143291851 n=1 Tax=Babylonia areolata TaxID=304850 RepID=UPI003FD63FE6